MQTYILALECETCGDQMRNRIGDITAGPGDEPVIDIAMAVSQTTFECRGCGGVTYLGDLEDICDHEARSDDERAES
jgi:hypothetical protein